MTDIVHYFDSHDKEVFIDIYVDNKILGSFHPDEFKNFYTAHPLIFEAVHHNQFRNNIDK